MRGVSPVVAVSLMLAVVMVMAALFMLVVRGATGIWPSTAPSVPMQLVGIRAWENVTELTFLHQGGEFLRVRDLSMILEGTLENGMIRQRVRLQAENLSTGGLAVALGESPEWARVLTIWASSEQVRLGKFLLRLEGRENVRLADIGRLTLIHKPSNSIFFSFST